MDIRGSVMGNTGDFDSPDPRSSRGPGASQLIVPAPCRLCHGPTWMQDELGAVHPCCALNGGECLACWASEALNREHRRRGPKRGWKEVKAEGLDG
jgi:hypothetical protein